jgi:hypothetical protein
MTAVGTFIFRQYVNYSYKFVLISQNTRYWLSANIFNQLWTGSLFGIGAVGRRKVLKIPRWQHRAGSIPAPCAIFNLTPLYTLIPPLPFRPSTTL